MSRFQDVTEADVELFERVREGFPDVADAKFKLVFRDKRKGGDDRIVFAEIRKSSDLMKHITKDIAGLEDEGLHYCMVIDGNVWNVIDEADKWRILRHELYHCAVQYKDDGTICYNLRPHSVETFYEEIEIEAKNTPECDPRWREKLATTAVALYDEMKEKEKAEKKGKRSRK